MLEPREGLVTFDYLGDRRTPAPAIDGADLFPRTSTGLSESRLDEEEALANEQHTLQRHFGPHHSYPALVALEIRTR